MRVCYLCPDRGIPLDGHKGAAAHVRGFVQALRALGHEVRVLTGAPFDPAAVPFPARALPAPDVIEAAALAVPPRLGRALGHLWMNVAVEQALTATLEAFRPELVYERYSPFSAAGALLARRAGVPHVLEVNAPLAWEGSRFRRQALADAAAALEQAAFQASPRIAVVSAELAAWLARAGVDPAKLRVVPNGVDAAAFSPAGPVHRPVPAPAVVIGFVGSLKPWHGLETLATAFRTLSSDPRLHLLVVGDGPQAGLIRELAAELPGRVTWTGPVAHQDVPAHVRGMDIAVAPYPPSDEFYFSPLKVLEYMAAGVPVVASAIGQVPQLLRAGESGVLVSPGAAAELAAALRALADDPARRTALGRAAAADVAAHHSWEQRVQDVLEWAVPEEAACSP